MTSSPVAVGADPVVPVAPSVVSSAAVTPRAASVMYGGFDYLPENLKLLPFVVPTLSAPAPVAAPPKFDLQGEVQSFFVKAHHFLTDLQRQGGPLGQLGTNLEGVLLIVRKTIFNRGATLNPVQRSVTQSGQVVGTVGGYDADGEKLTYSVVSRPKFGTLELGPDGKYLYQPGPDNQGADEFRVRVVSEGAGLNLFNLAGGIEQATEATIKLGAGGPTQPYLGHLPTGTLTTSPAHPPAAYFIEAPVSIGVDANNNPTISVRASESDLMTWQRPGVNGTITVGNAWNGWSNFTKVAGDPKYVLMGVEFDVFDGTKHVPQTAIFNSVTPSGKSGDIYTFTGQWATDPADSTGTGSAADSFYDIVGTTYKDSYENFRSRFGGENDTTGKPFNASNLDLDINSATIYFSNYTIDSYNNALAGTDPGETVSAPQPSPKGASSSTTISGFDAISVTLADGAGGFYEATGRGRVYHYRALPPEGEDPRLEITPSNQYWSGTPVTAMISYGGRAVPVYTLTATQSDTKDASTAVSVGGGVKRLDLILNKAVPIRTDGSGSVDMSKVQSGSISGTLTYGGKQYRVLADQDGRLYTADVSSNEKEGDPPVRSKLVVIHAVTPGADTTKITLEFPLVKDGEGLQIPVKPGPVSMNLGYSTQTGQNIIPGLVVGLGDGRVEQWTPGDPTDPSQAAGSWKELHPTGWNSAVNVLMPFKGRPDVCTGGCDGFVLGLNNGAIEQYNEARNGAGQPGWWELHDTGWNSAVKNIVPSKTGADGLPGFAVGLSNGAVEQWNNPGWVETAQPSWKDKQGITAMMEYTDGYLIGLSKGGVYQYSNDSSTWTMLSDDGENSAVTTLAPYGSTFAVGYQNGKIKHLTPSGWTERKTGGGSASAVTVLAQYGTTGLVYGTNSSAAVIGPGTVTPFPNDPLAGLTPKTLSVFDENQMVMGMSDGSTAIWDGTKWTVLKSNRLTVDDQVLREAVNYAKAGGKALANGAFVADDANIFYSQAASLQPSCTTSSKGCDASFYSFTLKGENPYSLAGKSIELGANGQSLDLSYDVGSTDYGYLMVPNGIWKKLNPKKYAFAVLASVYTGPSVTLNLGPDGVFSTNPVDLLNFDYTCNLVCSGGTGSYNVNVNVNAKVEGSLLGADGQALTDELKGHTYIVPGMVIGYNTGDRTFQFGAGKYIDSDYSDFKKVNGVEIKPTLTPSLTLSWGLFTSPNTPIIGEVSLFDLNLGYENPLYLDIDVQRNQPPSATVNSTGDITYGAGILDTIFPFLDYQGSLQVYSYTSPNLLGDNKQTASTSV